MKRCPQCQQTFSDENIFCLSDGTPLALFFEVRDEATVIRPFPFVQSPVEPIRKGVNPIFAYLAIGLLALVAGGGIVLWLKSENKFSPSAKNEIANVVANKEPDFVSPQNANLQDEQAYIEKERQKLANERRKLEALKNKPVEPLTITSGKPPTARINFRKGSMQETISGSVGSERSFVLRTKSGQYLSASVSSNDGCVVFRGGSASTSYTTINGDNRLSLVNNCSGQASFSLTVYIR